jgi:hypothetical protein
MTCSQWTGLFIRIFNLKGPVWTGPFFILIQAVKNKNRKFLRINLIKNILIKIEGEKS